ncbi:TonB family protein [Spirosoma foliorum]|uniref:TonB family protein n=1 Tax=Spirosoma foliorum TaxID=2710596 RepID=UPI001C713329|nr:TonB family protein [Spirosoma foliorum]
MNALDYLLKANLYGLLFAGCYWLLLRRHTFFSLNRAYLLASVILSLVLPLVILPTKTVETLPVTMPVGVIALPVSAVVAAPVDTGPDWEQVGLWAYALVALVLLVRLGIRVGRLVWLIRRSPQQVHEGFILVQPNDPTLPTFSFFQYIILNPTDTRNELILQHELVHVRQCHSADVLGMCLLQALFWACPTIWLIDRLLRQVHEFLADKPASQPTEYARFLVAYSFGTQLGLSGPDTLTNSFFNPSLLKQRIMMLQQKATTRWALSKYMLVLPLVFGLLAMTTAREEIAAVVSQVTDDTITVSGKITSAVDKKPLPGANVVVAGTKKGTSTNAHGYFKLENVPKTALLAVSFVGFTMATVPVENRTTIDVALALADPDELPTMGATAAYKGIKPNPLMPLRTPPSSQTINGEVYTAVEEPAVFPTGIPGLMQYVAHSLRYPTKAKAAGIQGNVLVQFVVSPTGAISSAVVKKGIGSGCNEEALRVVRQMPKWIPGKQNGKAIATQHVLPIQFALDAKEDTRTGQVVGNQLNDVSVTVTGYESPPSSAAQPTTRSQANEVFTVVEKQPEFPGGMRALGQYLSRNLRYPSEAQQNKVEGRVFVQFVVSQTGEIRNLRVLKGVGGGCDEEAVRVVSQMPKWNPGMQDGKAVDVQYNLPIQFALEKWEDKRTGQIEPNPKTGSEQKAGFVLDKNKNNKLTLDDPTSGSKERYAMRLPDSLRNPKSSVTIRGRGLLGELGGEPLYILDGVEVQKSAFSKSVSNSNTLDLLNLDPKDIKSIDVLKDGSAAAYGEKGKYGVIIITSKKK